MASDKSETMRLPPIGFWSYARPNEGLSVGRLGDILGQIRLELSSHFVDLEIYQDTGSGRYGEDWPRRIDDEIARATFLIPILTPHFVQSEWCLYEVERFLAREQALFAAHPDLPRSSRIFPIHYIEIDGAPSPRPDLVAALKRRNWFDMREMRYEERVDIGAAGRAIGNYAKSIRDVLSMRVAAPLSTEAVRAREAPGPRDDTGDAIRVDVDTRPHEEESAGRARAGELDDDKWSGRIGFLLAVALMIATLVIFRSRSEPIRPDPIGPPASTTPAPVPDPTIEASATIQFGSFPSETAAQSAWNRIAAKNAAIAKLRWYTETADVDGRTFYRLKARAKDADQAVLLCNALKISGQSCLAN